MSRDERSLRYHVHLMVLDYAQQLDIGDPKNILDVSNNAELTRTLAEVFNRRVTNVCVNLDEKVDGTIDPPADMVVSALSLGDRLLSDVQLYKKVSSMTKLGSTWHILVLGQYPTTHLIERCLYRSNRWSSRFNYRHDFLSEPDMYRDQESRWRKAIIDSGTFSVQDFKDEKRTVHLSWPEFDMYLHTAYRFMGIDKKLYYDEYNDMDKDIRAFFQRFKEMDVQCGGFKAEQSGVKIEVTLFKIELLKYKELSAASSKLVNDVAN